MVIISICGAQTEYASDMIGTTKKIWSGLITACKDFSRMRSNDASRTKIPVFCGNRRQCGPKRTGPTPAKGFLRSGGQKY